MKKVLEWGAIIIIFYVVWRWIVAFIATIGSGNTIQSSNYYQPGYPFTPYGVTGYPAGVYGPGYWNGSWNGTWNGVPPRGYPGGSRRW